MEGMVIMTFGYKVGLGVDSVCACGILLKINIDRLHNSLQVHILKTAAMIKLVRR